MAEILAPSGGFEQLTAAVRSGADSVYLGTKGFNARRNARNFDEESLPRAVSYCHARGVELCVTVNTLVMDSEMRDLEENAELLASSGVDAVIIQDMAVLRLFLNKYPDIKRVASTQTAVHNTDGARFLEDQGYDCIVLARELSLEEMRKICDSISAQTEAFVHGAHCMSLSGACSLSAMLGGRSGNRGLCAQPCRLDWRCGGREYALSLKDMSLISHIREMADAGVDVFKIEGRMKRPEYVAAAVTACRRALAGEEYDIESLRAVFSRSGFTDGYLTGKRGADMFGYRRREDVTGAEAVLGKLTALYRDELSRVPVDMEFSMDREKTLLSVDDGVRRVSVTGPAPEAARTRPTDEQGARKNLEKTGGTPFYVNSFRAEMESGLMLPVSALNAMRRDALSELLERRGRITPHEAKAYHVPDPVRYVPKGRKSLWGRFYSLEQVTGIERLERIIVPAEKIRPVDIERFGDKLTAQLPAALFPEDEDAFGRKLEKLARAGLGHIMTDNIYGIELGRRLGLAVHGGFGLNILNTRALEFYEALGLESVTVSFELSMSKTKALGGSIYRGIAAYGRLPLMRFRACPVRASVGCGKCGGRGRLTDRMGIDFPVECGDRKYSTLLNSVPLHIAERDTDGPDYLLLYFTRESPEDCMRVIDEFERGLKSDRPRTGGLYYRELL
ncbi:MAG: U32 family peptidase [Oscillospiraceae bacterium]|nr:U32 family peptidase [Oscillospiraceae bacterium]